jgi:hydroxypyruvate isomerase
LGGDNDYGSSLPMKFAANLSMMYGEHPFLERFAAAAADGFPAVEFLFPYEHSPTEIADRLAGSGLQLALFNLAPGNWSAGERGIAALPGREAEFAESVDRAVTYALASGCKTLHAMAGLVPEGADQDAMRRVYVSNLRLAAKAMSAHGITLVIEPINSRDMPGYYLNYQAQAREVAAEVGAQNLKVQLDLYHCQIMEGDLEKQIRQNLASIGHVQIAGVRARNEPDQGELDCHYLFALLDELSYSGFIGCEYRPKGRTSEGLSWFQRYRSA